MTETALVGVGSRPKSKQLKMMRAVVLCVDGLVMFLVMPIAVAVSMLSSLALLYFGPTLVRGPFRVAAQWFRSRVRYRISYRLAVMLMRHASVGRIVALSEDSSAGSLHYVPLLSGFRLQQAATVTIRSGERDVCIAAANGLVLPDPERCALVDAFRHDVVRLKIGDPVLLLPLPSAGGQDPYRSVPSSELAQQCLIILAAEE